MRLACLNIAVFIAGIIEKNSGIKLETSCIQLNQTAPDKTLAPPTYLFRSDLLTTEECLAYAAPTIDKGICPIIMKEEDCYISDKNPRQHQMLGTYLEIACVWENHTLAAKTTKRIRQISPHRAVMLSLFERDDTEDPITVDVLDPLRNQLVHLALFTCYSKNVTAKLYELGEFPNLFSFETVDCFNLTVRKNDFSRLPQLRAITLYFTTIASLEPGTFTDLPHLRILILEKDFMLALQEKGNPDSANGDFATEDN
ncbi:uncharacterized protein LOC129595677 isoform X2 [Paramacrobiotus metropolitanus]|nr:uncharacterized protein LOC129595677 isoform X2 [Paramacrobiotus metropolitanus]